MAVNGLRFMVCDYMKSIAKIGIFAILLHFGMKNFPVLMQTAGYYMQLITLASARICSDYFVLLQIEVNIYIVITAIPKNHETNEKTWE